ncbi:pilus assembly protein TadG-related protein [Myceligenerans crystallogenes]
MNRTTTEQAKGRASAMHPQKNRAGSAPDPRERGSISSWFITGSFVLILGVGIAVDLTGQVHTQVRANNVAAQAARVGGQQLGGGSISGGTPQVDAGMAAQAAQAYLAGAGMSGTVGVPGGAVVVVDTRDTYQPKFLSMIGISSMPVSGHGESRSIRVVDGAEQ